MIDIHSHILPGLDDGSRDLEEGAAMVRMAAEAGTTDIVASPHADLQYAFDPDVVERKIAELTVASEGVIRIHYGCDFHLYYENVQDALANPRKYAINHKNYLLVEPSELLIIRTTDLVLERLLSIGLVPIITHPERNSVLKHQLPGLERWIAAGCLVQVTAQSLLGGFGRQARAFSRELLQRGFVHFVASDAHDRKRRPPRLDEAYGKVAAQFGRETAERLFVTNPLAALSGAPLPESGPVSARAARKWWRLWA